MRVVIQVVSSASVVVDATQIAGIGRGFLLLVGVHKADTMEKVGFVVKKIIKMRIFSDEYQRMNKSVSEVGGEVLIVSQFTLYADCEKGNICRSDAI